VARRGDVTVRRLRPGDCDQLAALLAEAFAEEFAGSGIEASAVERQVRAAALTQVPVIRRLLPALGAPFAYFVAEQDGRVVGSTAVGGGRLMLISSVAVAPHLRGAGIGRALMEAAEGFAKGQGRDRVALDVLAHNTPAVRLYEGLGYREYHRYHALALALPSPRSGPAPPGYWLEPVTARRAPAFSAVERASLPPRYFEIAPTLRDRYVRTGGTRLIERLAGGLRAHRRALVHDARTAGFIAATATAGHAEGRIEWPLVVPPATGALPAVLLDAVRFIESTGRGSARVDISEDRPDQLAAAESIGFRHRWTYIQMARWLAHPVRIPVRVGERRREVEG
jgi:ribosomal protein S18 acetylase RimI-like enzyme